MFYFLLIALTFAQDYSAALKAGQRRFTSENLKGASGEQAYFKYDVELPERFMRLDYEEAIEDIVCNEESLDIFAKSAIDFQVGDVIVHPGKEGFEEGLSRVITGVLLVKEVKGEYEYHLETRQAELEDIFVKANIYSIDEEEPQMEGNLKGEWRPPFHKTYVDTHDKVIKSSGSKVIHNTVQITSDYKFRDFAIELDGKKATYFKMTMETSQKYQFNSHVYLKKDKKGDHDKKIFSFTLLKFDLYIGPVKIVFELKLKGTTGVEYNLNKAQVTFDYESVKSFTNTIKFEGRKNGGAYVTGTGRRLDPNSKPTLRCNQPQSATFAPYLKTELEFNIKVYAFKVITNGLYLKLKSAGQLNSNRQASFTPTFSWGYELKIIGIKVYQYEQALVQGNTKTITYTS